MQVIIVSIVKGNDYDNKSNNNNIIIIMFSSGKRLNNFIVGLSQNFNSSIGIQRGQYKLCGVYPSTTEDGGTFIQVCQDLTYLSRYVILQQSLNNEGLFTVCEAKVYAV